MNEKAIWILAAIGTIWYISKKNQRTFTTSPIVRTDLSLSNIASSLAPTSTLNYSGPIIGDLGWGNTGLADAAGTRRR